MFGSFVTRFLAVGGALGCLFWAAILVFYAVRPDAHTNYVAIYTACNIAAYGVMAVVGGLWTWLSHERAAVRELSQLRAEVIQLRQAANPYTGGLTQAS